MKKMLIKSMILIIILFSATTVVHGEEKSIHKTDHALDVADHVKSAILIERDTGEVLFNTNPHEQLPPASMTKVMTLLLIMESIDKGELELDEMIRISERAASMGGSQVFLGAGEEMSVKDLLKGIAISSGNDASVALAERIAGSEESFVKMMNDKVKELNLENTMFQNSSGLPAENQYSTSYDIAMISKELLKYETITDYTSVYEDYLRKGEENEFWLVNTNKLVRFYDGVDGLKTGFTKEAKYCLAATAKKNDMRVIAVVMGSDTAKIRNASISKMLDYAFNQFETKTLFDKGDTVANINVLKAENQTIPIVTSESISTLHKKGETMEDVSHSIKINKNMSLPLKKGVEMGLLITKIGDDIVSETPLTISNNVNNASYLTLLKRSMQNIAKYH